jgi:hypothetical protein
MGDAFGQTAPSGKGTTPLALIDDPSDAVGTRAGDGGEMTPTRAERI